MLDATQRQNCLSRMERLLPAYARFLKDRKLVMHDGSQVDLLLDEQRSDLVQAIGEVVRAMGDARYAPGGSATLYQRVRDLNAVYNSRSFRDRSDAAGLAFFLVEGLNLYELLLCEAEANGQSRLGSFLEESCHVVPELARVVMPVPIPRFFDVYYPRLSRRIIAAREGRAAA